MDEIVYFIRDNLVGTHYIIYAFIMFFLMFALIGYLFKQRYAKYDIKLTTSQDDAKKMKEKVAKKEEAINNNSNIGSKTKESKLESSVSKSKGPTPVPIPNHENAGVESPKPIPNTEIKTIPVTPQVKEQPKEAVANLTNIIPEIK